MPLAQTLSSISRAFSDFEHQKLEIFFEESFVCQLKNSENFAVSRASTDDVIQIANHKLSENGNTACSNANQYRSQKHRLLWYSILHAFCALWIQLHMKHYPGTRLYWPILHVTVTSAVVPKPSRRAFTVSLHCRASDENQLAKSL